MRRRARSWAGECCRARLNPNRAMAMNSNVRRGFGDAVVVRVMRLIGCVGIDGLELLSSTIIVLGGVDPLTGRWIVVIWAKMLCGWAVSMSSIKRDLEEPT